MAKSTLTETDKKIRDTVRWINELAGYWHEEIPTRIHNRAVADDGSPQWHQDFALWMTRDDPRDREWRERPEPRVRTTRAFRKLRAKYPREYEVLYRTAILRIPIPETTTWLNDRAIRNQKPERYTSNDTVLILLIAADRVAGWW